MEFYSKFSDNINREKFAVFKGILAKNRER
jgi:hypothetical protein